MMSLLPGEVLGSIAFQHAARHMLLGTSALLDVDSLAYQVVPHDVIEFDGGDDLDGVVIIGEKTSDHKNKQAIGYPLDWPKHIKSGLANDIAGSSTFPAKSAAPWDDLKVCRATAVGQTYSDDYPYEAYDEEDYDYDEDEYDDYDYDTALIESGCNFNLAAS